MHSPVLVGGTLGVGLWMGVGGEGGGIGLLEGGVGGHEVTEEGFGEGAVAGAGEVGAVALGETSGDPADHGSGASHAGALVVEGAVVEVAGLPLVGNDAVGSPEGVPGGAATAARFQGSVVGAQYQDCGGGDDAVEVLEQTVKLGDIVLVRAGRLGGLVRSVGQDDEGRVALAQVFGEDGLIPAEHQRSDCAVDAEALIGDAGLLGDQAQQADGGVIERGERELVVARGAGVREGSGASSSGRWIARGVAGGADRGGRGEAGVDIGDEDAIIRKAQVAAFGLAQVVHLQGRAGRSQRDGLAGAAGGDADSAEAEVAVAKLGELVPLGEPAGGLRTGGTGKVVARKRVAGELEAKAAVTKARLKLGSKAAGEQVRGGMRIAELKDADGGGERRDRGSPRWRRVACERDWCAARARKKGASAWAL